MVKSAGDNPVLSIMRSISKSKVEKDKHIDDYQMKSMAVEGCGARMLKAIKDEKPYALASAVKDLIKLCMDEYEENEAEDM